jgi:BRCA1-associated protein
MDRAERIRAEDEQHRAEDAEQRAAAERDRVRAEQRAQVAQDLARRLERELKEERAVSAGLLQNLSAAKASAEAARAEGAVAQARVRDMEDQVRDVMFALEVQNRIAQGGDMGEVEGGSVVVPATSAPPSRTSAKKKGRK